MWRPFAGIFRRIFRTLYGRIALTMLFLLSFTTVLVFIIALWAWRNCTEVTTQLLRWDLADNLRLKIEPLVGAHPDYFALLQLGKELRQSNPELDLFLLDADGTVLPHFYLGNRILMSSVDLKPIHAFQRFGSMFELPIRGDSPAEHNSRRIISVAPLKIGSKQGYLYLVLQNERGDVASAVFRENTFILITIALLSGAIIVVGLLGLALFYGLAKRLFILTGVLEKIEAGDLSVRSSEKSLDEIGRMARALNRMSDAVVKNIAALSEKDRLRRELVANVSHDLATPASLITNYTELLLMSDDALPPAKRRDYHETVLRNAQSLNLLLSDLNELSKLDAKDLEANLTAISIRELLQDIARMFQPKAEQLSITIVVETGDLAPALGDQQLLERVLINLVANALRHTPSGGEVQLRGQRIGEAIRIEVADTGEGIPAHMIDRVFERFFQQDLPEQSKGAKRRVGLSGLGLAIVRRIIELHSSTISVRRGQPNGTIFSFDLATAEPSLPTT